MLPSVATAMLGLDRSADSFFDSVVELVESEPRFAARVLAVANSVAGESQTEITTLRAAVSRMGSLNVPNLVLSMAVAKGFGPSDAVAREFWRHSIEVAMAASQLAALSGDPGLVPEEAYVVGLIHDIGRLLIFRHGPPAIGELSEGETSGLAEAELEFLGVTHAELGAMACRRWGLPTHFEQVVRLHHSVPGKAVPARLAALIQLVTATDQVLFPADRLPRQIGGQGEENELLDGVMAGMPPFLQLDRMIVHQVLRGVTADAKALVNGIWS